MHEAQDLDVNRNLYSASGRYSSTNDIQESESQAFTPRCKFLGLDINEELTGGQETPRWNATLLPTSHVESVVPHSVAKSDMQGVKFQVMANGTGYKP